MQGLFNKLITIAKTHSVHTALLVLMSLQYSGVHNGGQPARAQRKQFIIIIIHDIVHL
jgi:hypothetical protein